GFRRPFSCEIRKLHIPNHTDDLAHRCFTWACRKPRFDAFADWTLIGEIPARQSFVDHNDRCRCLVVTLAEVSALKKRYPHRAEIVGTRHADGCMRLVTFRHWPAFDFKEGAHFIPTHG